MIEFLREIKNHLAESIFIPYNEIVAIRKRPRDFPPFEDYCIVLSPRSMSGKAVALRLHQSDVHVDVTCIVRSFDPELSIIGELPESTGIIRFVLDTHKALLKMEDIDKNVVNQPINFANNADSKDFHIITIPIKKTQKPELIGG